jgi:Nif-specific regulatory protein
MEQKRQVIVDFNKNIKSINEESHLSILKFKKNKEEKKDHRLVEARYSFDDIITIKPEMLKIIENIKEFSSYHLPIIIEGETGTGKELFASAIHNHSQIRNNIFLSINCSAISKDIVESELFGHRKGSFTGSVYNRVGKFIYADGGTVFLDEISELPIDLQTKILRVIDNSEVQPIGEDRNIKINVRIIAATNKNLNDLIAEGKFRSDLYHRLNRCKVILPPLRDRKEDIPILVEYFIKRFNSEYGLNVHEVSGRVMKTLLNYQFPGNIRELKNILEYAAIKCKEGIIETRHFNEEILAKNEQYKINKIKYGRLNDNEEKEIIINALKMSNNNQTIAAKALGIDRKTLRNRIKKYEL